MPEINLIHKREISNQERQPLPRTVVEIGYGGKPSITPEEASTFAQTIFIDTEREYLKEVESRYEDVPTEVCFRKGQASQTGLENGSVDQIRLNNVFGDPWFNPRRVSVTTHTASVLTELSRILAPGGTVHIRDTYTPDFARDAIGITDTMSLSDMQQLFEPYQLVIEDIDILHDSTGKSQTSLIRLKKQQ